MAETDAAGTTTAPGRLAGRLIALGVTGSIAASKAVELLRLLQTEGADVVVLMTPSAAHFVGPLTFEALSRHAVETDVLALTPDRRIGHILLADSVDAIVVAPAAAHWLGAMANGLEPERLLEQWAEIDQLNRQLSGFRVLKGVELDILENGRMDLPDEVLAWADWVVASVHYGQNQPREKMSPAVTTRPWEGSWTRLTPSSTAPTPPTKAP